MDRLELWIKRKLASVKGPAADDLTYINSAAKLHHQLAFNPFATRAKSYYLNSI
ncbi:hypothetical protein LHU53_17400 [Rhodoferax sp. U2-2l]|uniref:hypothetical protein n=1 Tax=Rhodoferax sp. U2-2l TaxID=2884000 RepID=UPI001D0B5C7A|nr:hypothetical protein [Rhodoferax sp. U2-2l]MCB8748675.1 hypothetical protein [Rhodoferax sp. U2-2l]